MARSARSEAELQRIREGILEAASGAFARRGFEGITMEDLAREAGYSTASLYNYFPNKDAVLQALVARSIDGLMKAVDGPLPLALSAEQRIELVILRLLETAREHLWLMSLALTRQMAGEDPDPGSVTSSYMAVHVRFMDAMTHLVGDADWVPAEQSGRLANLLVSAVRTENFLWVMHGPPDDLPVLAQELFRFWEGGSKAMLGVA